ncbi:hypothetical protein MTR67_002019 [Solanum verrucosum]|uniref:Tf2-1-like SH3-like domain-containing protein n=1 Tax=Solanum verrucosum TaxID=315347 RepID=A0AAF0T8D1_SOLVR|nr:hypothetical protein MTR67_002019 [Solanum verrucosum]
MLQNLRENLHQTQVHMKFFADQHHTNRELKEGDLVYLKLQPYRQTSVEVHKNLNLSAKYYGPYKVIKRIRSVSQASTRVTDPPGIPCFSLPFFFLITSSLNLQVKGLSTEEFVVWNDLVLALPNRIDAISNGAAAAPKQSGGWERAETTSLTVKLYTTTNEAPMSFGKFQLGGKGMGSAGTTAVMLEQFWVILEKGNWARSQVFERAAGVGKLKKWCWASFGNEFWPKDQGLEVISEGMDTLKNMASDMNEIDKVTSNLKNRNVRLKDTVNQAN